MKLFQLMFLSLAAMFFVACGGEATHDHEHDHEGEAVSESDGVHFGETITDEGAISFAELMAKMDGQEAIEDVKVVATVGAVCQTKGCWMNISGDGEDEIFVQFKDYGFFMPKDLTDSKVVIQGKAYYDITSVEDLKHFAEDEGLSQEEIDAITEPKMELKFMAAGVKVLERSGAENVSEEKEM